LPGQTLHDEEGSPLPFGDIENADDVLVIELGDQPSFLLEEPVQRLLGELPTRRDELEGDDALEHLVSGLDDLSHASPAELPEDLEAAAIPPAEPLSWLGSDG
jgi:hypothetical protein